MTLAGMSLKALIVIVVIAGLLTGVYSYGVECYQTWYNTSFIDAVKSRQSSSNQKAVNAGFGQLQLPTPTVVFSQTPHQTPSSFITPVPVLALVSQKQSGKCNVTLNGTVCVDTILGVQCQQQNNIQTHACIENASECNSVACVSRVNKEVQNAIIRCGYSGLASFNEEKTRIDCQTEFVPGVCQPAPTPGCSLSD